MLEVKLSDFENYKEELLKYARNLLKTRGFAKKDGELVEFSKDVVQDVYIDFHLWGTSKYVDEKHLISFLKMVTYRKFLMLVDSRRKGAQQLMFVTNSDNSFFKDELKQLNINMYEKPTAYESDTLNSFKRYLKPRAIEVLDLLMEGYSQVEIGKKLEISEKYINRTVGIIREMYNKYAKK